MPIEALDKAQLKQSKRQLSMVLDLNKCIGCQTCTMACKMLWTRDEGQEYMYWNNVETRPGHGFPRDWERYSGGFRDGKSAKGLIHSQDDYGQAWDYNYQETLFEGKAPNIKTNEARPKWGPNWDEDEGAGNYPNSFFFYFPRLCNHCTNPACLNACPRNAIYKRSEDGIVVVNQDRCHGYRFCVEACPYDKVYWNHVKKVSQKCIFCFPRIEQGIPQACAAQCVGRIRFVGYLDDPDGPTYKLVKQWQVALPLHQEFGTVPNVYYIPPLSPPRYEEDGTLSDKPRIPEGYLLWLFGPRVPDVLRTIQSELDKVRSGSESELMKLLQARSYHDLFKLDTAPNPKFLQFSCNDCAIAESCASPIKGRRANSRG
jgi:DMSO reductase family type II enzyme iron-sulfur subunit